MTADPSSGVDAPVERDVDRRHLPLHGAPVDGALVGDVPGEIVRVRPGPSDGCGARGILSRDAHASVIRAIAFGELGLHRLQADTLVHNTASRRVLAKTGFEAFGRAPRYLKIAGRWQDCVVHQLPAPDRDASPGA